MTSQLFANVYLDAFDHFVKETLRQKHYIRYTDDAIILATSEKELRELLAWIQWWPWQHRHLELHPHKLEIRKLRQGIDFLGYVTLPHYRVLRTKTKRRMLRKVDEENLSSYLGLLEHCAGYHLRQRIVQKRTFP